MEAGDLLPGPSPQIGPEAFARRRARVADALGDGALLVVATHEEALHSHDVHYRFRPHSDLWYLTGFGEPESAVVVEGGTGRTTLFLRERKPEAEVWTGRRVGVERAVEAVGVDAARPFAELGATLREVSRGKTVKAVVAHHREAAEAVRSAGAEPEDGRPILAGLRVVKDAEEIAMLRKAAKVGMAAQRVGLRRARAGRRESDVEAALLAAYREARSTGPGYPPIVGAGANAAVLHYVDNRSTIRDGELVLVDAGCEWGYYNSDITRTVPASGEWEGAQRDLYEWVWRAQQAALREVKPGNLFRAPHDAAVRVLTEGLVGLGWLDGDVDQLVSDEAHRRFYMHGTSHFLGLDVHDPGPYKGEDGKSRPLEPGMVLTVEPGLYANPDYTEIPAGVRPFGIRIENDVVVTEDGHEDLNADLATDPDGVLELVRG